MVELAGVALLEVGATAAADEHRVAGEDHRLVVEHEAQAAVGVAGGGAYGQGVPTEAHRVAVADVPVSAARPALGRHHRAGAQALTDVRGAGDVVGVHVGLDGVDQLQVELGDDL